MRNLELVIGVLGRLLAVVKGCFIQGIKHRRCAPSGVGARGFERPRVAYVACVLAH